MNVKKVLAMALAVTLFMGNATLVQAEEKNKNKAEELTIDTIEEKIENMTIEEKIGQTLMIAPRMWNGEVVAGKNKEIEEFIKKYNIGGVALFEPNFNKGAKGAAEFLNGIQQKVDIPLLVSIDQEGGSVTRISEGTRMVGNMALGATNDEKLTEEVYQAMGKEIKSIGVNLDLAPVSEVAEDPFNTVIGLRSFGSNKENVGKMVRASVKGLHNSGTMAAIKHFPGQSSVSEDTHLGITIIPESKEKVKNDYMYAFKEGVHAGADFVMPTHAAVPSLDSTTVTDNKGNKLPTPTTFSKTILTDILRNEIGFNGVVITDAMDMRGITEGFSKEAISEKAFNAGCDILLMSYDVAGMQEDWQTGELVDTVKGFDKYFSQLVQYIKDGTIKEERLNEAVRRILTVKVKNNLYKDNKISLEDRFSNIDKVLGCKENKEIEKKAAEKAVTLVKNENNMLPMKLEENKKVVIYDYSLFGEWQPGINSMEKAMNSIKKELGIKNLTVEMVPINIQPTDDGEGIVIKETIQNLSGKMDDADYVIIAPYNIGNLKPWYEKEEVLPQASEIPEKLIDYANKNNKKYVSLNLREPYGVAYMSNSKSIVSVYANLGGDFASSFDPNLNLYNVEAGIRTIFGLNKPQGKLPVDVKKTKDGKIEYSVGHGLSYN